MNWLGRAARLVALCVIVVSAGCQRLAPAPIAFTPTAPLARIAVIDAVEAPKIEVSRRTSMLAAGIYIMGDFTDYHSPVQAAIAADHFVFGDEVAQAILAALSADRIDAIRVDGVQADSDPLAKAKAVSDAGAQAFLEVEVVRQGIRANCPFLVDCNAFAAIDVRLRDTVSGQVLFQRGYRYAPLSTTIYDGNADRLPYDDDRYDLPSSSTILESPEKVIEAWRAAIPLIAERVAAGLQPLARRS